MEAGNRVDDVLEERRSLAHGQFGGEESVSSSNLFLDLAGQVNVTLNSAALSWKPVDSTRGDETSSTCFGIQLVPESEIHVKFSDVYAVELINFGLMRGSILQTAANRLLGHDLEMYRFAVHAAQRSQCRPSVWTLTKYTFGHKDLRTCQTWVNQINAFLNMERGRPTNLLVFVHPMSGKGKGCRTWEAVAPIFSRAKIKTKVIMTQRAGQAFDVMASITNKELNIYDGVVAVGGDGFFNEILNGFLSSRHKAPYPPVPDDFVGTVRHNGSSLIPDQNAEFFNGNEDSFPLNRDIWNYNQDAEFTITNGGFRFGIIPAGSTDAIVICTTGVRDPITSALQIVLGKKVSLDLAQVVRWKATSTSNYEPCVRYAASFAGYGFYGDVISESEKYRWMGPKRYDYAGTKVFLRHRSYEAEIACLEVESEETCSSSEDGSSAGVTQAPKKSEKAACIVNCTVCNAKSTRFPALSYAHLDDSRWLRFKGRFLSVGAAVISCRNEKAPDGLVAGAHLSDGFLHLILIKDCPHAFYLWHLTELARKNGNPLKFDFVEHHKTPAFTFTSLGRESVWNLDGELFPAHKLSAQVHRGLVSLFATGPEA